MTDPLFYIVGALVVGLCVGSFLNVVIHRLPKMLERGWQRAVCRASRRDRCPKSPRTTSSCRGRRVRPAGTGSARSRTSRVLSWLALRGTLQRMQERDLRSAIPSSNCWAGCSPLMRSTGSARTRQGRRRCVLLWTLLALTDDRHRYAAASRRFDAAAAVGRARRQSCGATFAPLGECGRRRGRRLPVALERSIGCSS